MRTCERCKEPLVNDRAGHSADGRLVCTRTGCQLVEEMNRQVADGRLVFVETEQFATKVEFPTKIDPSIKFDPYIHAVIRRPLPPEDEDLECVYAQAFSQDNSGIGNCLDLIDPDYAELAACYAKKTKIEECCEPCQKRHLLSLVNKPGVYGRCPHDILISSSESIHEGQPYCECCKGWLGPPPVDHKLCLECRG